MSVLCITIYYQKLAKIFCGHLASCNEDFVHGQKVVAFPDSTGQDLPTLWIVLSIIQMLSVTEWFQICHLYLWCWKLFRLSPQSWYDYIENILCSCSAMKIFTEANTWDTDWRYRMNKTHRSVWRCLQWSVENSQRISCFWKVLSFISLSEPYVLRIFMKNKDKK